MSPAVKQWTEDEIDSVKLLWLEGWSASIIGRELGRSTNSVIGKVFRLKLESAVHAVNQSHEIKFRKARETKVRRMKRHAPPEVKQRPVLHGHAPPMMAEDVTVLRGRAWEPLAGTFPKPLELLDHHSCRWPTGESPFLFCAAPIKGVGFVYCPMHTAMSESRR